MSGRKCVLKVERVEEGWWQWVVCAANGACVLVSMGEYPSKSRAIENANAVLRIVKQVEGVDTTLTFLPKPKPCKARKEL